MTEKILNLFKSLLSECERSNAKETLTLVKEACDSQVDRSAFDFSISTIVRIMQPNGPSESTVRNKAGERYRALIAAYKQEYGSKVKRGIKEKDDWVNEIDRVDLRWMVKDALAENTRLKGELNALKGITKLEIDMRPSSDNGAGMLSGPKLDSLEMNTMSHFLSPEALKLNGFGFDKKGCLININTLEKLSGPKFESAINKIILISEK